MHFPTETISTVTSTQGLDPANSGRNRRNKKSGGAWSSRQFAPLHMKETRLLMIIFRAVWLKVTSHELYQMSAIGGKKSSTYDYPGRHTLGQVVHNKSLAHARANCRRPTQVECLAPNVYLGIMTSIQVQRARTALVHTPKGATQWGWRENGRRGKGSLLETSHYAWLRERSAIGLEEPVA